MKQAYQHGGWLEDGAAHQDFQFLDGHPAGLASVKAGHQLLDFLVLGQEDFERRRYFFFFESVASSARVLSMTC